MVRGRLQLDQQHGAAGDEIEHLGQGRDAVWATQQRRLLQLRQGHSGDRGVEAGHPLQGLVVEHHHLAVEGQADIELDPEARLASPLDRRQRVLGCFAHAPEPAVGEGRLQQAIG